MRVFSFSIYRGNFLVLSFKSLFPLTDFLLIGLVGRRIIIPIYIMLSYQVILEIGEFSSSGQVSCNPDPILAQYIRDNSVYFFSLPYLYSQSFMRIRSLFN